MCLWTPHARNYVHIAQGVFAPLGTPLVIRLIVYKLGKGLQIEERSLAITALQLLLFL